jgi:hypothetical protein
MLIIARMSDWWPPILQTAIGGIIGATGAVFGGAFGSWFNWQKERQSLAAAFAGEVEAVKAVVEFRRYREVLLWSIERTKATGKAEYLTFSIDEHPFPAFEQNVSKIGHLPPDLARDVVLFYNYAKSLVQDIRTMSTQNLNAWPVEFAAQYMEKMVEVLDAATKLAEQLIPKLRDESTRDWKQILQQS